MALPVDPVAPVTPIPTIQKPMGEGAEKQLREYAQALLNHKYQPPNQKYPFYTWANGLDKLSASWLGGKAMREADLGEMARLNKAYGTTNDMAGGGPPASSPASPPTAAAPGGAAPAAPFPGRPASSDRSSESTPAEAALNLSARGETSKTGHAALFNISPDTAGSKSYGPLGLNSKSGSVSNFVRDHPEFGLTAEPGTPEFDNQWRKAAATQKDEFGKAHEDWHKKNIMGGLFSSMTKAGVDPAIANDPRVQTYMADRKVQMGNAGLNTALAAASGATSPESFIHTVSQVDKDRVPLNFKTYLRDHPNDERGLHNRIDLRHNTALAMADPDTTGKMVDYYKGGGDAPVKLAGDPSAASGSAPTGAPSGLPSPGAIQQDVARAYRGFINSGVNPLDAEKLANSAVERRLKLMPQFEAGPYGQIKRTAPGEIPSIVGMAPGFPGVVKHSDLTGTDVIEKYDPKTGDITQRLLIPRSMGGGAAGTPAPTVAPSRSVPIPPPAPAVSPGPPPSRVVSPPPETAPAASPPASVGPVLTSSPPGMPKSPVVAAKPGDKLAMADIKGIEDPVEELYKTSKGGASKLTKLAADTKIGMPDYDLGKPKTPVEVNANKELDWAEANPSAPLGVPNRFDEAMKIVDDPTKSDYEKIGALRNRQGLEKADIAALEDEIKVQNKGFSELQKNIRDSQKQSEHLAPELKVARRILDSSDFHPGPASKLVENVRGLQEEAESAFRTWATDARKYNEDAIKAGRSPTANPGMWDRMADWVKTDHSATANQVYQKILSGSILQSLRGMLGPNAGQFRVQELRMLEQAFGNPNVTLEANKVVMSMVDKINDRNMLIGQMADKYIRKHRKLDSSFEEALSRFEQKNPVFTPEEYDDLIRIGTTGRTGSEPPPAPGPPPAGAAPPGGPTGLPSTDEIRRERERRDKERREGK